MNFIIKGIALVMLMLMVPVVGHAQYTFTTNNGTITITGYNGAGGTVIIPDTINGLAVTAIGANNADHSLFQSPSSLTSVILGTYVTAIGNHAFEGCKQLVSVTLGTNIATIGDYAFNSCIALPNLIIPKQVSSIGFCAFFMCQQLTNIIIPKGVTTNLNSAFSHCDRLATIIVDVNNNAYSSLDGVLFDKSRAIDRKSTRLNSSH